MAYSASDIEYCRKIQKRDSAGYYFATKLFPRRQRVATHVLYAFFRVPDEYVDNPTGDPRTALIEWQQAWHRGYSTPRDSDHPVIRASVEAFRQFSIPEKYTDEFLAAMIQDITVTRYETYADLQKYMYGSASVVGLIMSHVLGFSAGALPYAEKLAEAMQYTNFLRDIEEDLDIRGRVYIPQEILRQHGVTEDMLREKNMTPEFVALMKAEIARAHALFAEARSGIPMLHSGRYGVRVSSYLYEHILDILEARNYNVFGPRVSIPFSYRIFIALREIFR